MLKKIFVFILFIVFSTPVAALDPASIGQNVVAEWQSWMQRHGIDEGALVVAYEGQVIAEGSINRSVDDPAKVASLSKSITAVCALKAVGASGASYRTPLSEAIPAALGEHSPIDDRFADITVGQLITHTSGITSRYHRHEIEKLRTFEKENKLWQFSKLIRERLSDAPGEAEYHYSNANYLTLGLVIEELTGEDYEAYCQREVLDPAGVTTSKLNQGWRVMSAWGGWEISAADFLRFAEHYFGQGTSIGRPAGVFLPAGQVGRGASYGAGVLYRRSGGGSNIWHLGSWRWNGRISDRFGAYFAIYENGFSVSTNYAHDAWEGPARNELDQLLWDETHR